MRAFWLTLTLLAITSCDDQCPKGNSKLKRSMESLSKLVDKYLCEKESLKGTKNGEHHDDGHESESIGKAGQPVQGSCDGKFVEKPGSTIMINCWIHGKHFEEGFSTKDVDVDLCTHATLFHFFVVNSDFKVQINAPQFADFEILVKMFQAKNKPLILSIGGDYDALPSKKYSEMAKNESSRMIFTDSVMDMIEKYNFNGFLINWQYPVFWDNAVMAGSSNKFDVANYVQLANRLSEKLKEKKRMLLAIGTNSLAFNMFFDLKKLQNVIDLWVLPAFHFEGPWSMSTTISSSYSRAEDMMYSLSKHVPYEKMVLGIPTYYWPVIVDPNVKSMKLGASLKKTGKTNPRLKNFRLLCEEAAKGGLTIVHNETGKVNSYAYTKNDWVSYESSTTVVKKMDLVFLKNLTGVYVDAITTDDYDGKACNCGKFHILRAINNVLRGSLPCETKVCP